MPPLRKIRVNPTQERAMRTRIDRPPSAGNTLRHQQPMHDALARQVAEFEARGGTVELLPDGVFGQPGRSFYNGRMVGPKRPPTRARGAAVRR